MTAEKACYRLLKIYAAQKNAIKIDFNSFLNYVRSALRKYGSSKPELAPFADNDEANLGASLENLVIDDKCSLEYSGNRIARITYLGFYFDRLLRYYKDFESSPDLSFPDEKRLGFSIPENKIVQISVQSEYQEKLEKDQKFDGEILRLVFPSDIPAMLIPGDIFPDKLLVLCLKKISLYLNAQRNADYIFSRLAPIFSRLERMLKEAIRKSQMDISGSLKSLKNPNDFNFRYWSCLTSQLLKEFSEKGNRLEEENSYCQAAYLVSQYNGFFKGINQKAEEEKSSLNMIVHALAAQKEPITFTDLLNLKDKYGSQFIKKIPLDKVKEYIENKSLPAVNDHLAEIIVLRGKSETRYIHRDRLLAYVIGRLNSYRVKLKGHYLHKFQENLRNHEKTADMLDDQSFDTDIFSQIKIDDKVFSGLLNYSLLAELQKHKGTPAEVRRAASWLFDISGRALSPLHAILKLDRKSLLQDAKAQLSFWETAPFFSHLKLWLDNLFKRFKKETGPLKEKSQETAMKTYSPGGQRSSRVKTAVAGNKAAGKSASVVDSEGLIKYFIGDNGDLSSSLNQLAERWNPIITQPAKDDLLSDVNLEIRTYIRKIRSMLRPGKVSAERVENLARQFVKKKVFNEIREKEAFLEYVEIYILKIILKR